MAFRTVMIVNPCYLSTRDNQLVMSRDEVNISVPLEDIACIIIDNHSTTLSSSLLVKCAIYNIVLISCDAEHIPNGVFNSYLQHSRQALVINKQLNLTQPFKKQLWQRIIKQKITNQAECLKRIYVTNNIIDRLNHLAKTVSSGDSGSNEANASRIYFTCIFGGGFHRIKKNTPTSNSENHHEINASLNYTYSIVRSLICRSLVGYGLLPNFGLFHNNQLNSFNLADDFIEPFRSFVDWYVYTKVLYYETNNLIKYKDELVNVLNYNIIIDNNKMSLLTACDVMIKSYINAINNNDSSLIKLPELPEKLNINSVH